MPHYGWVPAPLSLVSNDSVTDAVASTVTSTVIHGLLTLADVVFDELDSH